MKVEVVSTFILYNIAFKRKDNKELLSRNISL